MTARSRSALAWSQSSVSPAMARPASWSASPPISPRAITPSIWHASPRSCSAARAAAAGPTWRRPAAPTAPRPVLRSQRSKRRWPRPKSLALFQEHVVRGVGRALEAAGLVASTLELAACRVDPLHRGDARQDAAAAVGNHLKLQPWNVAVGGTRRIADGLADHCAAVAVLPVGTGVMTADRLAVDQQRRDWLAEDPVQLAVGAGLAFIDLRAFGMHRQHGGLAGRRDRIR